MTGVKARYRLPYTAAAIVAAVCVLGACTGRREYTTMQGAVWNTTYTIKYDGPDVLTDSVMAVMQQVELSLSPFNPNSRISRINTGSDMRVDGHITRVHELSREVNRLSGGAFDPTLSPLINLWGFGYTGHDTPMPADSTIARVLESTGIYDCVIADGLMHKKSSETTFNYSAVTKGYGCDMIAQMLRDNGVANYMVEIGGELALGGVNERGELWRVMVDAPVEGDTPRTRQGLVTIAVSDCGIATSGNYRNYRDMPGCHRIGHTISAVTGRPVKTSTLSATVIAPDCATADALATACMAMQPRDALKMIELLPGTECLIVEAQPDSTVTLLHSPAFPF